MAWFFERKTSINKEEMNGLVLKTANQCKERICNNPKRVLLLPPDITRAHSGAGWITKILYDFFNSENADVYLMPTLGQHVPHTEDQNK